MLYIPYVILISLLVLISIFTLKVVHSYSQVKKDFEKLQESLGSINEVKSRLAAVTEQVHQAEAAFADVSVQIDSAREVLSRVHYETEVAKVERQSAVELAEKDLQLEGEKRRAEFEAQLASEFEEKRRTAPITIYEHQLEELNAEIEQARKTLKVQQEQALQKAEEEDFIASHSIGLTEQDQKDIKLIRQFAPQLTRQEAFFKLIWTEFYQRPLQQLCKVLGCDKVTGIYKITNIKNQRMYIGQAIDIGARWKDHVKCGLGIGTTSYLSNKFYKALHDDGPENFTFEVLEICQRADLNDRERYWIDFYNANTYGYNTKTGG